MGLFDFGKKKGNGGNDLVQKLLSSLTVRKVEYAPVDFLMLQAKMSLDPSYITKMEIRNYYATSKEKIVGTFYSDSTFTENYLVFDLVDCGGNKEKIKERSEYYKLEKQCVVTALQKAKINISDNA